MTKILYSPTANLVREAIDATTKTQREIARDAGLPHPNVLSMMKTGECKVPITRIPKLATALGIDASTFIEVAMHEYHPEIWMTLKADYSPLLEEKRAQADRHLSDRWLRRPRAHDHSARRRLAWSLPCGRDRNRAMAGNG